MAIQVAFYVAAVIALVASLRVVTHNNAIHALLYLIVSLLAVAVAFYLMGAPFAAGLEVIVYAGAIMVLFVFVVMMFDLGIDSTIKRRSLFNPAFWAGPGILAGILFVQLVYLLLQADAQKVISAQVSPKEVGIALYGPYLLAVEIASFLLLGALVAGYHIAKPDEGGKVS